MATTERFASLVPPAIVAETDCREARSMRPFSGAHVVEVVSPGDRAGEIEQKVAQWLEAGVRLVWVVYPATRHVVAFRELAHPRVYTDAETIDAEPVLPGFSCPVAEIFACTRFAGRPPARWAIRRYN